MTFPSLPLPPHPRLTDKLFSLIIIFCVFPPLLFSKGRNKDNEFRSVAAPTQLTFSYIHLRMLRKKPCVFYAWGPSGVFFCQTRSEIRPVIFPHIYASVFLVFALSRYCPILTHAPTLQRPRSSKKGGTSFYTCY